MKCRRWTPEDIEVLCGLAGDMPWRMVTPAFNRTRPARTETALRHKAWRLSVLRKTVGQFITRPAIAQIIGGDYEKIRGWIRSGKLVSKRFGVGNGYAYFINRKDLQEFAKTYPEKFGGLTEAQLTELLDSERLAAKIVAMELPKPSKRVPVECVETGQRYPSILAAAKSAYVSKERMRIVVNQGTTANNRHYRRVDQPLKAQSA